MQCERQNTLVFSFEKQSPRVNAFQIHEWLAETVRIHKDEVHVIQINGPLRKVYVKFITTENMMRVFQPIQSDLPFHHANGEISKVQVDIAGYGIRRVRISSLPPEVTEAHIRKVISYYGDVKTLHDEVWSQAYRFKVKSGFPIIEMGLKNTYHPTLKLKGTAL